MKINRSVFFAAAVSLTVAGMAVASTTGGRFFPDAPVGQVQRWSGVNGGAPREVDINLSPIDEERGGMSNVGTLRFSYDTYLGAAGTDAAGGGGAILAGGFYAGNGWRAKDGLNLAWVQTVTAIRTGGSGITDWNLPATNAGEYPDAGRNDPRYTITNPPQFPAGIGAPTLGFQDIPSRFFADGNQSWTAELALVAITKNADGQGFKTVNVIGSLLWGFSLNTPANTVTALQPTLWGAPTASFLNTLNSFYSGNLVGGGGALPTGGGPLPQVRGEKFRFVANTNVFIPTPGTIGIMALAGVAASRRRRAA